MIIENSDFLEKDSDILRFNPYDANEQNCLYQQDSAEFYIGDIGLFSTDLEGKSKN